MRLYLFDFDGTVSKIDSFIMFSFFSSNISWFLRYWSLVLILFPFVKKSKLKENFYLSFKGQKLTKFNSICKNFVEKKIFNSIKISFLIFIKTLEKESQIVIVSASISNYLKPWCDEMGFDLISSELEVIDGKLTGKFSTPNCNGKEKVRRIKEKYNLSQYNEIHVFGNSKGDFPMLELGTHKYYKFFK
jgi:phosphatidylglycerophosphatase C